MSTSPHPFQTFSPNPDRYSNSSGPGRIEDEYIHFPHPKYTQSHRFFLRKVSLNEKFVLVSDLHVRAGIRKALMNIYEFEQNRITKQNLRSPV